MCILIHLFVLHHLTEGWLFLEYLLYTWKDFVYFPTAFHALYFHTIPSEGASKLKSAGSSRSRHNLVKVHLGLTLMLNSTYAMMMICLSKAKFPHSPILHYAYSLLLKENNNANNRLPLGLFALFSRSWIFSKSFFKPSKNRRFWTKNCA